MIKACFAFPSWLAMAGLLLFIHPTGSWAGYTMTVLAPANSPTTLHQQWQKTFSGSFSGPLAAQMDHTWDVEWVPPTKKGSEPNNLSVNPGRARVQAAGGDLVLRVESLGWSDKLTLYNFRYYNQSGELLASHQRNWPGEKNGGFSPGQWRELREMTGEIMRESFHTVPALERLWSSAALPGWGQMKSNRVGWGSLLLAGHLAGLGYLGYLGWQGKQNSDAYFETLDTEKRRELASQNSDLRDRRNLTLIAVGGLYLINVLDAWLDTPALARRLLAHLGPLPAGDRQSIPRDGHWYVNTGTRGTNPVAGGGNLARRETYWQFIGWQGVFPVNSNPARKPGQG